MREADVALRLFLAWLRQAHGRPFGLTESSPLPAGALAAAATDGSVGLAAAVQQLQGPTENQAWLALRQQLERDISTDLKGSYALWIPAGADLPTAEPELSEFVQAVRQTALTLSPGQRTVVPLPIALYLRKVSDEGSLVSVSGGLNPYWARLTESVRGQFDLDSTRLHRLPDSPEQLLETVWEHARQVERAGQWVDIPTIDPWTIQRLMDGEEGVTIVGIPPEEIGDMGLEVRRNFRRILADAAARLRDREADARALVVLGYYPRMDQEGATTAMRGYDPALYANLDFVCLAADGLVRPLIQAPAGLLPWAPA